MSQVAGKYSFVGIDVSGIQSFIFSTGKLKEMVGSSEIIFEVADNLLDNVRKDLNLDEVEKPSEGLNWIVILQKNAGTVRAILPNGEVGRQFLRAFSAAALEWWPGLPLNGALVMADWSQESLKEARSKINLEIDRLRASQPVPEGLGLLPILEMAPLDGLAAVERDYSGDKSSWLSWPSKVKRNPKIIDKADDRLKNKLNDVFPNLNDQQSTLWPVDWTTKWCDDFDEMLEGFVKPRLALIHFDVNDLGHLMAGLGQETPELDLVEAQRKRQEKSEWIDEFNLTAMKEALKAAVTKDLRTNPHLPSGRSCQYNVPLRPLVMGGDDVTVLVRADLAFPFLQAFIETYEDASRAKGSPLSLGAGMLIMPPSYPFNKASQLVEELTANAKSVTKKAGQEAQPRPSSLDYLVITSDVEDDLDVLRSRVATSEDGYSLTGKPFILERGALKFEEGFLEEKKYLEKDQEKSFLRAFLETARQVLHFLPKSHTRQALSDCRRGRAAALPAYLKLRENVNLRLGGRFDMKLMQIEDFDNIFPRENGFFIKNPQSGQLVTYLADFLELADFI
jgi:hypothetical protein